MAKRAAQTLRVIDIKLIDEPKGIVRMDIDREGIEELAESISEIGLLQPILVCANEERYEVVFGHRRLLACRFLALSEIRCILRVMSQSEIGIARATENIARDDLTPVEEAATYQNLIDGYGMKIEEVAKKMGKTPGTIKRRMDILRMPAILQKAVHGKKISMTVAEELWAIRDETSLDYYLGFAIENGCTREVARMWTQDWKDSVRRSESPDAQGGGDPLSPLEPRPTYVPCDLCHEAVQLGKDRVLRACPDCFSKIQTAVGGIK